MHALPPCRHAARAGVRIAALLLAAGVPSSVAAADDAAPRVTFERAPLAAEIPPLRDAQGRALEEVAGVSLRWWARHGRTDVGVGVGTLGFVPRADAGTALLGPRPTVTLGWRYRLNGETAMFADATGVRALAGDGPMPGIVNTKVGLEWKPATSRFGFEHRSIGVQLQSGYRMSLRVRGGGLGVYLRGQF
jgi:hypothetical protein